MNVKPMTIQTVFPPSLSHFVDAIDIVMRSYTPAQREVLAKLLIMRKLPESLPDTPPEELIKLAAMLGIQMAAGIAATRDANRTKVASGN